MWVQSLGQEDPLEEGMATHSSILALRIPWTEEPAVIYCFKELDMTEASEYVHMIRGWLPGHCLPQHLLSYIGGSTLGGGRGGQGSFYSQGKNIKLGFGKFWYLLP